MIHGGFEFTAVPFIHSASRSFDQVEVDFSLMKILSIASFSNLDAAIRLFVNAFLVIFYHQTSQLEIETFALYNNLFS